MNEIGITNLNNIISDYKKKLKDCKDENMSLKNRVQNLEIDLKKERKN